MKLMSLLVAVLIVGLLLKNQLTSNSPSAEHERTSEGGSVAVPDVPSAPEDCLLYTSPSPRDGLLSRMPSSA